MGDAPQEVLRGPESKPGTQDQALAASRGARRTQEAILDANFEALNFGFWGPGSRRHASGVPWKASVGILRGSVQLKVCEKPWVFAVFQKHNINILFFWTHANITKVELWPTRELNLAF